MCIFLCVDITSQEMVLFFLIPDTWIFLSQCPKKIHECTSVQILLSISWCPPSLTLSPLIFLEQIWQEKVCAVQLPKSVCNFLHNFNLIGNMFLGPVSMAEKGISDISGLVSRANNPLHFLGLFYTSHAASTRHHIPAKVVRLNKLLNSKKQIKLSTHQGAVLMFFCFFYRYLGMQMNPNS